MKKRFYVFPFLFFLSGFAGADVIVNLAVAGVLVAGFAIGSGLILAGAGAAWGLGIGLGANAAGLYAVCAAGLISAGNGWCEPNNVKNMADTSSGVPLSVVLTPGSGSSTHQPGEIFPSFKRTVYSQDGSNRYLGYQMACPSGAAVGGSAANPNASNLECLALEVVNVQIGGGRDTSGDFVPSGDNIGGNTTGLWIITADGSSKFVSDGAPLSALISSDRKELKVSEPDSSGNSVDIVCKNYADKTMNCSLVSAVPITDSQGNPATVKAVATQSFDASGNRVGAPVVMYSPLNSLGGPFDPNTSSLVPSVGGDGGTVAGQGGALSGGGTGGAGGTGGGSGPSGTGNGSCTSGDCSTESTQLANKGLLQAIKDFFTGAATAPDDPTARTGNDIKGVSLDGTGAFTGLKGWQLPAHASQCPTSSFAWNGNTYTFDAHCQLVTDHFAAFRGVMTLVFSLSALFVVLKA